MSAGKRIFVVVAIVVCVVPVVTLTNIYTNFSVESFISHDEGGSSDAIVTDANLESLATLPVEAAEAQTSAQVAGVLPPELAEAESVLSAIEKDRANLDSAELKDEIEKAEAIIVEMDQLISQADIGHTKPDGKEISAAEDEIGTLQAQLLDATAAAE